MLFALLHVVCSIRFICICARSERLDTRFKFVDVAASVLDDLELLRFSVVVRVYYAAYYDSSPTVTSYLVLLTLTSDVMDSVW
jgi:hypothetical protein